MASRPSPGIIHQMIHLIVGCSSVVVGSSGMAMLASGCFGLEIASDDGVCAIKIPLAVCTLNKQFNKMGYLTGVVGVDTTAL
jgi:hypothetical protein